MCSVLRYVHVHVCIHVHAHVYIIPAPILPSFHPNILLSNDYLPHIVLILSYINCTVQNQMERDRKRRPNLKVGVHVKLAYANFVYIVFNFCHRILRQDP